MSLLNREPAVIIGAIQAALVLAVSFGLDLSKEQMAAILSLSAAILSIVTRQMVVPKAKA